MKTSEMKGDTVVEEVEGRSTKVAGRSGRRVSENGTTVMFHLITCHLKI